MRYAETNGFERDSDKPEIWRYRDWVIETSTTHGDWLVLDMVRR